MRLITHALFTGFAGKYKAPKGLQYLVESINFTAVTISDDNQIVVIDRLIDDATIELGTFDESIASATFEVAANNLQWNHWIGNINHKTKYLSIATISTNTIFALVTIYGQLVPITKIDAIMEWFRKGR